MTRQARTAILAVATTLAVLLGGGFVFLYSGAYNVAATEEHTTVARWILNTGQNRSVAVRADEVPDPPGIDSTMVAHGFQHFREMCIVCHGAPGVERGEFGRGMRPTPPPLSEAAREFSTRELFWIVKHGIRLAGMPAFGPTHTDEEIWGIVAFLERLEGMTEEDYARWQSLYSQGPGDSAATTGRHGHAPEAAPHSH